jgi:hypothetical protein
MSRLLAVVLVVVASLAPLLAMRPARADVLTLPPIHDAFVNSAAPDKSYGSSGLLQVRGGASTNIRSFLSFDMSAVPGVITTATLRLHVHAAGTSATELYRATGGWSEATVTWSSQPELIGAIGKVGSGAGAGTWVEYDLTAAISGDRHITLGLLTSGDDRIDYLSKDSDQATKRPHLVISYEQASPTPPDPTASPTGSVPASATPPAGPTWTPTAALLGTMEPSLTPTALATQPTPSTPLVRLSHAAGEVYDALRVNIRGFPADTTTTVSFDDTPLVTVPTDAEGSARTTVFIPLATAGDHLIRATGGGQESSATYRVRPRVTFSPSTVAAGTPFTVIVRGYGPTASVAIRLYGVGSSTRYVTLGEIATSATGTGKATFVVGAGTRPGLHKVAGAEGANIDDATLTVTAPAGFTFSAVGDVMTSDPVGSRNYLLADQSCALAGTNELVLMLGDLQYSNGSYSLFTTRFDVSSCGAIKDSIRPVPGNHEYQTSRASGYFRYFGEAAGDPARGYYSFTQGGVHFIAVNSNCGKISGGCGPSGAQYQFIRDSLAANPSGCTVMYSHHPRYSSSNHGGDEDMDAIWDLFATNGGDIVLSGHDHSYERFAPMDSDGNAVKNGVRQFVVGTGGYSHYQFRTAQPNSEVRLTKITAVLQLTVDGTSYSWKLVSIDGVVLDSGRGSCH